MSSSSFAPAELDALLSDHDVRANVDHSLAVILALGLDPRPEVIREQAALNEVAPDQVELLVGLIGRRLSTQEGSL